MHSRQGRKESRKGGKGLHSMIRKNNGDVLREERCRTKDGAEVLLLKYPLLEGTGLVKHCFTTRLGGVSEGIFSTMNLSFTRGDDREAVETNYRRLSEAIGVKYESFVFTDQTHTANIRKVTAEDCGKGLVRERDYREVDGLITNERGPVLSAFFADCVPLYFVDPVHRAIGLSHSGWRGTVKRMGAATVAAMQKEYKTVPEELICAIGPSICQDCYEVGEEVADAFRKEFAGWEDVILKESPLKDKERKYRLDLWKANEIVLLEAGVKREHLAVTDICTCCNPDVLFSHRATGGKRGNVGAFLCLK